MQNLATGEKTIRNNILTLITVLLLGLAGTEVSAQHKCLGEKLGPPEALYDNCTKLGICL
jgi:hypothetical protein